YHQTDYSPVPDEASLMDDLRRAGLPPGDYVVPFAGSTKEMATPEYIEKVTRGPVAFITIAPSGRPAMGRMLSLWFVFAVAVSIAAAYVSGRALGPGADYLEVFRFAATTAIIGYCVALWQDSIWYYRSWSTTLKSTLDGVVYGLVTAGMFGTFWP